MNSICSLPDVATWALNTSVEALPIGVAILILARSRVCHPRWRAWLAALFFIRLLLPAVPGTDWNRWNAALLTSAHRPAKSPAVAVSMSSAAPTNHDTGRAYATASSRVDWRRAAVGAWLLGVIAVLSWLIGTHLLTRRWLSRLRQPSLPWFDSLAAWARERQGINREIPVVMVPGLSTMAVFGWARPQLLIPADLANRYSAEQIRGMLLHEFAHIRRLDVLWTWLAMIACAFHWFNPLAWLAFRRFCADRELICDASALEALGEGGRFSYGDALLRSLEVMPVQASPSLAPFFRVHPEIKHRILMITKPVPPTLLGRLAAALLFMVLGLVTFTTGRAQSDREKGAREEESSRAATREGEGEGKKSSADRQESELDKYKRENAQRKAGRDGERKREGNRDGEMKKDGRRDGERPSEREERDAARRTNQDGERRREGARDGDGDRKQQPGGGRESDTDRDKEKPMREEARDRDGKRDGDGRRNAPRDGENVKDGPRDGEVSRSGPRDGDSRRAGPRDGDSRRAGPRDGEETRDGDRPREGDGERKRNGRED